MPPSSVLLESYQTEIDHGRLQADPCQVAVLHELQALYHELVSQENAATKSSYLSKFFTPIHPSSGSALKGLYIWGGVGRGKTYLVNSFYQLLPIRKKLRLHFHRFMQLIHEELETLDSIADPLKTVARSMAKRARLICLDEMLVDDITDAMLLAKLFEYLFEQGVVFVITSNVPPHKLYENGLQREHFLPAIHLLETHNRVVKLDGDKDYRLQTIEKNTVYLDAGETSSESRLEDAFNALAGVELHKERVDIIINKRRIPVKRWADGVVWFHFDELCRSPRSAMDYQQIGTFFNTVIISEIPVMDTSMDDSARRFITLIDTLYDLHVNLIVSAYAEPEYLYTGHKLNFAFQRTASRLRDMQSTDYIATQHMNTQRTT